MYLPIFLSYSVSRNLALVESICPEIIVNSLYRSGQRPTRFQSDPTFTRSRLSDCSDRRAGNKLPVCAELETKRFTFYLEITTTPIDSLSLIWDKFGLGIFDRHFTADRYRGSEDILNCRCQYDCRRPCPGSQVQVDLKPC